MRYKLLPLAISIILAIIPFFWLKPGWMDLGGDSSRLYFYDPINYLRSFSLWGVVPDGFAGQNVSYYLIPFVFFLSIGKFILHSSYLLITLFNSMKLVVAFLSIYNIALLLLASEKKDPEEGTIIRYAATIAGVFYAFSPILTPAGWDKAMFVHNQFFLNPLMVFLLLKYLKKNHFVYLLTAIILSFFFAPNFSPAPSLFSFYPLIFTYLMIYTLVIKRGSIGLRKLLSALLLFTCVHLFHLIPFIANIFSTKESVFYNAIFSQAGIVDRGLSYFLSQAQANRFIQSIFSLPQGEIPIPALLAPLWAIFPAMVFLGFILQQRILSNEKEKQRAFLLSFVFFLISLFFVTANVTQIGFSFYKSLFAIPGFSMFRNYVGQFAPIFAFFYAINIMFAIYILFRSLKLNQRFVISFLIVLFIFVSSWNFIRGDMINLVINPGQNTPIHVPIKMDPDYEKALDYIRQNAYDTRYLTLPFTEAGLQMVAGVEGGAYQGPSTIPYLTGKKDFSGYQVMLPFSELFLRMMRNKEYESLNTLLGFLGVKYIFYNSDPYIYLDNFPGLPYSRVNAFTPQTQQLYQEFIEHLAIEKKLDFGPKYHLYELKNTYYVPHIYVANTISFLKGRPEDVILPILLAPDSRVAVLTDKKPFNEENEMFYEEFIRIKKNSEFYDDAKKKQNIERIATSATPEQYTWLYPYILLPQAMGKMGTTRYVPNEASESANLFYKIEKLPSTTYEVYARRAATTDFPYTIDKFATDMNSPALASNIQDDEFTMLGKLLLDKASDIDLTIFAKRQPNIKDHVAKLRKSRAFIISDTMLTITRSIISSRTSWNTNSLYFIAFEYYIPQDFLQTAGELQWNTFAAVIETNDDDTEAFLLTLTDDDSYMQQFIQYGNNLQLQVKNITLTSFSHPDVILHSRKRIENDDMLPKITFRKINPTKYEVKVRDVHGPYVLVLQDEFNTSWKLFFLGQKTSNSVQGNEEKPITASYFGDEIQEGYHQNRFLDAHTFDTWGLNPLDSDKHFMVNAKTNGWFITPSDTNGKTEYTFILELDAQRLFYILFGFSILVFSGCFLWLIVLLSRALK